MAIGFLIAMASCSKRAGFKYEEGIAWNTLYHITYESDIDLRDSILIIFNGIDSSLSPFNERSVVSKINSNISDSVDIHFIKVFQESLKINRESEGAFDPTLAPIIRAWGFGQGHVVSNDTLRLDSLLQITGIHKTQLADNRIIKENPEIEFNFSALAKGYGVDCIADMLERNGVRNYLVEVGGEIRASGHNPSGSLWKIGIDYPSSDSTKGAIIRNIRIENSAVATSGNYRNFHEQDNRRFGHTISPVDGRPAETDVISATVIAPECMEADAIATSCMVLGSEKALNLCTRLRVGVMLIKSDMSVVVNPAFESLVFD